MNPAQLFQSAKNSAPSGILVFIRQPVSILRLTSILISIIVFGCISSGCFTNTGACIFNDELSACRFPTAVGVFAFLAAIGFLISDFMFNSITHVKKKKIIIIGDLAFSGLWAFFWFISFCLLANKWTNTTSLWLDSHVVESWQKNNARSAIVFSIISVALWSGITFFALQRFRLGDAALGIDHEVMGNMPGPTESGSMGGQGYSDLSDPMSHHHQPQQQQQQQQQQGYPGMNQPTNVGGPMGGAGGQYYEQTY